MKRSLRKSIFKKRWLFTGLRLLLALGIAFFICQIQLDYLESMFYDLRVRLRPTPATSNKIVIVNIDIKTQEMLKRLPDANDTTQLFKQLNLARPKKILYTQDFSEVIGSYEELELLAEAAAQIPFVVVEDRKLPEVGLEEEFQLLPPLQNIQVISGPKTNDSQTFAKDGVSRRIVVSLEGAPLLHAQVANEITSRSPNFKYRGQFEYKRTNQLYINYRPADTYESFSFIDVAEGRVPLENFTDKIVIIGRDTRSNALDYVSTPYSRDVLAMSRGELHANMLDTLILNNSPLTTPDWVNIFITCLIAILTVFVVLTLRPARGLMILGIAIFAFAIVAWALFATLGLWIDVAHPFLAIFICYYFFIPYRLIIENRKSWEYYQRNTLLTQVEELKSNFLRMMSHDLKTPLARIQGMTEIALRDENKLSSKQIDALKNIGSSSEELTDFVGSILNLGRIESKEIKLQLKSKDINALLSNIVQNLKYLAQQKNITITTEFEPMFSLKVDEDLIRQVFTNLIENAIKYSPENSSILISTEEVDGRLVIQVADQGMGIPKNEQPQLFSKFYRSRNVRDGSIKGSGLGLYLSRYFVNLHKGAITVESEPNKGSTFTVELPMNL
ncbi:MAG: CHASE2 domain-containing protein [Bdellovibrionales bacterium]|nr:CHASE2 domain-containing protein [Bdellovibrionales bacterium]